MLCTGDSRKLPAVSKECSKASTSILSKGWKKLRLVRLQPILGSRRTTLGQCRLQHEWKTGRQSRRSRSAPGGFELAHRVGFREKVVSHFRPIDHSPLSTR
jgi:hypothetical protein